MKKVYMIFMFIIISFASMACNSASRMTSEEIVRMIETLDYDEVDLTFYDELNDYEHIGDAYYLLGEKNDYIELVMYYKQKYVKLIIDFDYFDGENLMVEQINVEYFDLLDEVYVYFNTLEDEYMLQDKTYDDIFGELEALSFSDIEWILSRLDLM